MIEGESSLIALFIILLVGLVLPGLLRRFHLPFISLLLIAGAVMGPFGFGYIESNIVIEFLGFLGMAFLMLMTGLETRVSLLKKNKLNITKMALFNGGIPFVTGFLITYFFGYSLINSLIIGIIFISSSVAVIVPSLKSAKVLNRKTGQIILAGVLLTDIISLVLLGIVFQFFSGEGGFSFLLYIPLILLLVTGIFYIIPFITRFGFRWYLSDETPYEGQIRFIIVIAIGILILFSFLGVHPILAAFLAGIILSGSIKEFRKRDVYHKLHILGYGLFIPIFFFIVGMELDLSIFLDIDFKNLITLSLVIGLISSKIISGYFSGKMACLDKKSSLIYGTVSMTQLTTTLAATYAASALGLLDTFLVSSIILISIITTILGPASTNYISRKMKRK